MKRSRKIYSVFHLFSAILMILVLMWLTISTPFVFAAQQEQARQHTMEKTGFPFAGCEEEAANPFGNNTEEKTESSTSLSEEFLHHNHKADFLFSISLQYHKCENAGTYIAFHGELLVPPPNAS